MDLSYILNELGEERDQYFNAIAPPIIQSSNFAFKNVGEFRSALQMNITPHSIREETIPQ